MKLRNNLKASILVISAFLALTPYLSSVLATKIDGTADTSSSGGRNVSSRATSGQSSTFLDAPFPISLGNIFVAHPALIARTLSRPSRPSYVPTPRNEVTPKV